MLLVNAVVVQNNVRCKWPIREQLKCPHQQQTWAGLCEGYMLKMWWSGKHGKEGKGSWNNSWSTTGKRVQSLWMHYEV